MNHYQFRNSEKQSKSKNVHHTPITLKYSSGTNRYNQKSSNNFQQFKTFEIPQSSQHWRNNQGRQSSSNNYQNNVASKNSSPSQYQAPPPARPHKQTDLNWVTHFYALYSGEPSKKIEQILSLIGNNFTKAVVYSKNDESVTKTINLLEKKYKVVVINRSHSKQQRQYRFSQFVLDEMRVLVTSAQPALSFRSGFIDVEDINLIVNQCMPEDVEQYKSRYTRLKDGIDPGTKGIIVNLIPQTQKFNRYYETQKYYNKQPIYNIQIRLKITMSEITSYTFFYLYIKKSVKNKSKDSPKKTPPQEEKLQTIAQKSQGKNYVYSWVRGEEKGEISEFSGNKSGIKFVQNLEQQNSPKTPKSKASQDLMAFRRKNQQQSSHKKQGENKMAGITETANQYKRVIREQIRNIDSAVRLNHNIIQENKKSIQSIQFKLQQYGRSIPQRTADIIKKEMRENESQIVDVVKNCFVESKYAFTEKTDNMKKLMLDNHKETIESLVVLRAINEKRNLDTATGLKSIQTIVKNQSLLMIQKVEQLGHKIEESTHWKKNVKIEREDEDSKKIYKQSAKLRQLFSESTEIKTMLEELVSQNKQTKILLRQSSSVSQQQTIAHALEAKIEKLLKENQKLQLEKIEALAKANSERNLGERKKFQQEAVRRSELVISLLKQQQEEIANLKSRLDQMKSSREGNNKISQSEFAISLKQKIVKELNLKKQISQANLKQNIVQFTAAVQQLKERGTFLPESHIYENLEKGKQIFLKNSIKQCLIKNTKLRGKELRLKTKTLFEGQDGTNWDSWLGNLWGKSGGLLMLLHLQNNHIICSFTQNGLPGPGTRYSEGNGFMASITNMRIYQLKEKNVGKGLKYDQFMFMVGNNEILVKNNLTFNVIFNKQFCYYECGDDDLAQFVGEKKDQGKFKRAEFHQIAFIDI